MLESSLIKLNMAIDLQKTREEAEQYYESKEYADKVIELFAIITAQQETLQNLHIALDLEGVITNVPFDYETQIPSSERLRRPLAKELIEFLNVYAGRLTIWTAATGTLPWDIIRNSGIVLPQEVELVDRYKYIFRMITDHPDITKIFAQYGSVDSDIFPEIMPESLKLQIINIVVKVARVYDVDYLFDDGAMRHRALCRFMGLEKDAEKLVYVPPFTLKDEEAVANHHKDETLLKVIETFLSSI